MEELLYNQLIELLSEIPELRYIDLDMGQLYEEKPPLAYPAALFEIDIPKADDIDTHIQKLAVSFSVRIITEQTGSTNSLASKEIREKSIEWLRLQSKVYKKLQGFKNKNFYSFSRTSGKNENLRTGLRTFVLRFSTSCYDYTASS